MDKIKVAVRLRPFNKRELEIGCSPAVTIQGNQVQLNPNQNKDGRKSAKLFAYDCCFDSSSPENPNFATQQHVYDGLGADILDNSMLGYNACILAYGQTGSGKSFTMMGTELEKGITPRLCESLFERINRSASEDLVYKVELSYMEIYNEKCRDLLDPSGSKQNLRVREHQLLGPYVDGLSQLAVTCYKDIEVLLNEGNKSRTVAATNMNSESSRSHAVFCLRVSQILVDRGSGLSGEKVSRLSLVDLAGSEKVSKTGVEGERLKEGCNINRSLHTLGQVIFALADNATSKSKQTKHIPYRDSVLTWLLKDSIGGNSKTVMISTISPSLDNYEETLSTLRYADRAKRIVNNAVVNEDPNAKLIRDLREEVEMLKRELEKAKEKISAELLTDRLKESEKLYEEVSKPWDEKLAETEKIQQEWNSTLQSMGISVQSSGIKVENDKYYLVNLNADPSMNELLVYYLKEFTRVGRPDATIKQDIQLQGPGIAAEHCVLYTKNNYICVAPAKEANTWVNGKLIQGETVLHHGDRIVLGINHFFRLNCPAVTASPTDGGGLSSSSSIDFSRAQEEVLLHTKSLSPPTSDPEPVMDDENRSTSSIFSSSTTGSSNDESSSGLVLEMAIQKFEQEYSALGGSKGPNIPKSDSCNSQIGASNKSSHHLSSSSLMASRKPMDQFDERFRKGLKLLRERLLKANYLVREANSLCKEMGKSKDSLLSEPAILVKNKTKSDSKSAQVSHKTIIDLEKFENLVIRLRESYSQKGSNNENDQENTDIESIFTDNEMYYKLIGVANVFLDVLVEEGSPEKVFEYDAPIVNQQGELSGRLRVRLQRLSDESDRIKIRLGIERAYDLPVNLNNLVFCQYRWWWTRGDARAKVVMSKDSTESAVFFDHQAEVTLTDEDAEDALDYCVDGGALSIEVLAHRTDIAKPMNVDSKRTVKIQQERLLLLNQAARMQALVDAWSKLSRSFEMKVRILELNSEGNWSPVEVRASTSVKTGGIYQLRQGQSRQISVNISQTGPDSVLNYNGLLFTPEAHKIDRISVGSISYQEIGVSPLDSYQEVDLNRLRDKCRSLLELRKQYLYAQLKQLADSQTEEDKERYESLCKQLADLGDEQAAVDAPSDDSHLPGATLKWSPTNGMEEHVPIVFLDMDENDLNGHWSHEETSPQPETDPDDQYFYDTEEFFDQENYPQPKPQTKRKNKRAVLVAGQDNVLRLEKANDPYIELRLASFNDSSGVEIHDSAENSYTEDYLEPAGSKIMLKAVGRWDSSEHKSIYLNKETPLDAYVYLIVKANLKFKLYSAFSGKDQTYSSSNSFKYIDVVFRKRICVCVKSAHSAASGAGVGLSTGSKLINLNKLKNILGSTGGMKKPPSTSTSNQTWTGVTYRVIAAVPRLISEPEDRESLAIKAAALMLDEEEKLSRKDSSDEDVGGQTQKISLENSWAVFEHYARTVEAVDSLLKRDRTQQQVIARRLLGHPIDSTNFGFSKSVNNSFDGLKSPSGHSLKTDQVPKIVETCPDENLKGDENQMSKKPSSDTQAVLELYESLKKPAEQKQDPKDPELASGDTFKLDNLIFDHLDAASRTADDNLNHAVSNLSIASTLTNSSSRQVKSSKSADEPVPEWVREGVRVIVATNSVMNKRGRVRFIGETKFGTGGIWIGVELDQATGKNDGSVKGHRYFQCPDNCGVFVRADKLSPINEND